MMTCQLTESHFNVAREIVRQLRNDAVPWIDVQLVGVALLSIIGDIAHNRSECVDNSLAMLAQLPGIDGAKIAALVRQAAETIMGGHTA